MKRLGLTATVLALAAVFSACSGTVDGSSGDGDGDGDLPNGDGDGDGDSSPGDGDSTGNGTWTELHPCRSNDPRDSIEVSGVSIEGDELVVDVGHSAGCAEHEYGLCYSQDWAESDPVQVTVEVLHDDGGEMCEAYEMSTLRFDISSLASEYEERYKTEHGEISLHVEEYTVLYRFGPPPTWEEIYAQIEELNTCEMVEDCAAIATKPCEGRYLNASADTTQLEIDIDRRLLEDYGQDPLACDASCQCGVLTCSDGRCVTMAGTCEEPAMGQVVCL